jgi:predicted ester cyclase
MTDEDNRRVVLSFYDGWNQGIIDFDALVDNDIVNYQPEAAPEHGRASFAEAIAHVMAAVPDSQWAVSDVLDDGDRVAVRITWSGTYHGSQFRGFTVPTPARFSVEHIHIYRVASGKLTDHWVVRDDLAMLKQLGVFGG